MKKHITKKGDKYWPSKAMKKKAKRSAKRKKLVKSREKPVKIVFQCYYGVAWSGDMAKAFESYLKKKGLTGLFEIKLAGVKHTPAEYKIPKSVLLSRWRKFMREADFVVALTPELYKAGKFKIPTGVRPIYTYKYGVLVPDKRETPVENLFDALLEKTRKKFELVVPDKKK